MMKRVIKRMLFSIGLLSLFGVNVMAQQVITINGRVPEIKDGEVLLVAERIGGLDTLGRANLVSNNFQIKAKIDHAKVAWLQLAGYEGGFMGFFEPGEVYEAVLEQNSRESISGGNLQTVYLNYQKMIEKHNLQLGEVRAELEAATNARHFKTASEINKKVERIQKEATEETESFLNQHRDNVFAAYVLTSGMQKAELAIMEANYEKLSEEEQYSQVGQIYASYIKGLKSLNVGALAADFTLEDPNGKKHSLYTTNAKIKIIDFWASWCGPCRLENPNMIKLYNEFKDSGLEVIGVSLDDDSVKWVKAIADDNINWLHLIAEAGWKSDIVKRYYIDGVPTIYVLDHGNKIIAKNLRGDKLRSFVAEYLEK